MLQSIRRRIVIWGSQIIYGTALSPAVADRVPLISAGLRYTWLRLLAALGLERMVATSSLGHRFVCHIGDLAEHPFYYRHASEKELLLAAAWLQHDTRPIIYDVGANVGYFATQLVQMLRERAPEVYAFEAVPTTFLKLLHSIDRLGLRNSIHPVAAAVMDIGGPVRMSFSDSNSLEAKIAHYDSLSSESLEVVHVAGLTLDDFSSFARVRPALVKIDVEGSEGAVLRGSQRMTRESSPPVLMIEYHPRLFREISGADYSLDELLADYAIYYIDDLLDRIPFGTAINSFNTIDWICNIFAVPKSENFSKRWLVACTQVQERMSVSGPSRHFAAPLQSGRFRSKADTN
jgi:FkbM family methyltransferase